MNVFGILVTPGHLIIGGISIVVYDALWTWAFSDAQSHFWFERLQGLLKLGIYAGFVGLVALVAYTPWPVNLIVAIASALSAVSLIAWLRNRSKKSS